MKKLLSLLLCLLLLTVMLTACGDDKKEEKKDSGESTVTTTSSTTSHNHTPTSTHSHTTPPSQVTSHELNYRCYTNADKTFRVQILSKDNKVLFERDKLINAPIKETVSATVVSLSWATGKGPNDYETVYWNKETGQLSEAFWAPRACDGVRVAYPSADQTKIIVQDITNPNAYHKEYVLEDAYTGAADIIVGGKLQADKKTVLISYIISEKGETRHASFGLYE